MDLCGSWQKHTNHLLYKPTHVTSFQKSAVHLKILKFGVVIIPVAILGPLILLKNFCATNLEQINPLSPTYQRVYTYTYTLAWAFISHMTLDPHFSHVH